MEEEELNIFSMQEDKNEFYVLYTRLLNSYWVDLSQGSYSWDYEGG